MKNKKTYIISAVVVLVLAIIAFIILSFQHEDYSIADKHELKSYVARIEAEYPEYQTTDDIKTAITAWADSEELKYKIDEYDNIIFQQKASDDFKDMRPTVVCVPYNVFTMDRNLYAIAMGEYLAKYGLHETRANIIFINNVKNLNEGAKKISSKYFPSSSNVILLDSTGSTYISRQSFTQTMTELSVPYEAVPRKCDSGVKIKISGIKPDIPGGSIKNQPNPISTLNSILTKLRSKALSYQIAKIDVDNNGNLYPSGIELTILINSYSIETVTKYLDSKAENYVEDFIEDFPDLKFEYEVIEDSSKLPDKAYSDETTNYLYNLIYTVKNGTYRFKEDEVPDGFEENQVYGVNCYEDIFVQGNRLVLKVNTSALSTQYMEQIMDDNKAAAFLSEAQVSTRDTAPEFINLREDFALRLEHSYSMVNDTSTKDATIKMRTDSSFTPCSYFVFKNKDLDTIHLSANKTSYYKLTNAIMNVATFDHTFWSKHER